MPDGDTAIDETKLPRPQRWMLDFGPWLVVAVGLLLILYPIIGTPATSVATTCLVFGGLVVVTGAVFPRAKSFKLTATGVEVTTGTFSGPATAPKTRRRRARAGAAPGGRTAYRVEEDEAPRPTIGTVVDAAVDQGWTTSTRGDAMTLTNPDHQSFSFSRNDAADPISDGFLQALQAYGLTWPSNS